MIITGYGTGISWPSVKAEALPVAQSVGHVHFPSLVSLISDADLVPDYGLSISDAGFLRVSGYWFRASYGEQAQTGASDSYLGVAGDLSAPIDYFAKAMYAATLADLGQHSNITSNNVLIEPLLLEYLSGPISSLASEGSSTPAPYGFTTDYATASYKTTDIDRLNITDSYIYTQYQCQIPTLKSTGSLIVSVLIADLVLLQGLWTLLNWGTTAWLEHNDSYANFCKGCVQAHEMDVRSAFVEDSSGSLGAHKSSYAPLGSTNDLGLR